MQSFLATPASASAAATSLAESQSHAPKMEEAALDWTLTPESGSKRVTAFAPFKHGDTEAANEDGLSGPHEPVSAGPPFSLDDISAAIYNKMAARYAAVPQPHYPRVQQQPPIIINLADAPADFQRGDVDGDSWGAEEGGEVTHLVKDAVDVTSVSAQKILDEFMRQLQTHQEAGEGKQLHEGKEGRAAGQQTDKGADRKILWEQRRVKLRSPSLIDVCWSDMCCPHVLSLHYNHIAGGLSKTTKDSRPDCFVL